MQQISEVLGFNKNSLYYQSKSDASEVSVLREEIERLAARHPMYGYRRITKLLVRMGYRVGYRHVVRLEEVVHLNDYEDIHEARARIGHFIIQVYHQKRRIRR